MTELWIVFDGPPSHESGRFVDVENAAGESVRAGEWKPVGHLWTLGPFVDASTVNARIAYLEKQHDAEIARWQKAIYEACREHYPAVDGAGSDSGDALDFTLCEIEGTFIHLIDEADDRIAELERGLSEVASVLDDIARSGPCGLSRDLATRVADDLREILAATPSPPKEGSGT